MDSPIDLKSIFSGTIFGVIVASNAAAETLNLPIKGCYSINIAGVSINEGDSGRLILKYPKHWKLVGGSLRRPRSGQLRLYSEIYKGNEFSGVTTYIAAISVGKTGVMYFFGIRYRDANFRLLARNFGPRAKAETSMQVPSMKVTSRTWRLGGRKRGSVSLEFRPNTPPPKIKANFTYGCFANPRDTFHHFVDLLRTIAKARRMK